MFLFWQWDLVEERITGAGYTVLIYKNKKTGKIKQVLQ